MNDLTGTASMKSGRSGVKVAGATCVLAIALALAGLAATAAPASAATWSGNYQGTAFGTSACISGGVLGSGHYLLAVYGSNSYKLVMQTDGNLVEYKLGGDGIWHPLWDSQTATPGAHLAVQASDGNLVIYSSTGKPLWAAFSFLPGQPAANYPHDKLCLQTDGNVVLYSTSGAAVWATNTMVAAGHRTNNSTNPFQVGQCTWGADIMFHNYSIYPNQYIDWRGDAWAWAANAQSRGWNVGTSARAGSIAVYQKYAYGAGGYGHVAWVLDVYPSQGKVLLKEANWTHHLVSPYWDTRLATATDASANRYTGQPNIQYIYDNPSISG